MRYIDAPRAQRYCCSQLRDSRHVYTIYARLMHPSLHVMFLQYHAARGAPGHLAFKPAMPAYTPLHAVSVEARRAPHGWCGASACHGGGQCWRRVARARSGRQASRLRRQHEAPWSYRASPFDKRRRCRCFLPPAIQRHQALLTALRCCLFFKECRCCYASPRRHAHMFM